ncbi:MAG TPA: hypothetical protein PLQ13_10110 [Candidatus Krumholzibacteria bacterium]|nr:hypothetical protein [Candidatus Krumholzibacteria bacterium]
MGLTVCALIIGSAAAAVAGIPDLQLTTATRAYAGVETLSLYSLPNGGGRAFSLAFLPGGAVADATITMTLRDGLGNPIANFPFEDMWIEAADGGLVSCGGNAVADFNTDANGVTSWGTPLFAGGNSQAACLVKVNGDALTSNLGMGLTFNSADINGDGLVNLSDGGYFSQDLTGAYNYRSDFNNDGIVNVADAGYMANGLGAACP